MEVLETIVREFRKRATKGKNAPQLFITTHQPYFVDALSPKEIWVFKKREDGFVTIQRASSNKTVQTMVEEGLPLGGLWHSDYLDEEL